MLEYVEILNYFESSRLSLFDLDKSDSIIFFDYHLLAINVLQFIC